ncbi:MAG: hypothetical protein CSA05_00380 [Bacteroidia bacterium]|nr:MAG: hypothetical protein CSB01_01075 [Bacteroidia bacterium]PIE86463.1 MAG: hypothetical protein CSA05_00380 [Bacteroidia bacterium]
MSNHKITEMKNHYIFFGLIIVIFIMGNGFNQLPFKKKEMFKTKKGDKYAKQWRSVDSLEQVGQVKTALQLVEKIYEKATSDKNSEQIIKATIFKIKFTHAYKDDAFKQAINRLQNDTKQESFPTSAVMHSMLADMYWMYYTENRWKFLSRTEIEAPQEDDDIDTWTLNRLAREVIKHRNMALENQDSLQRTSIDMFDEIVKHGTQPKELRPTLYDFFAHKAIDFYMNTELTLTQAADKFELKEAFYFDDADDFVERKIESDDLLSLHFHAIKQLQALLAFRLDDKKNKAALINADLKRLNFIYENSVHEEKDSLYLAALTKLQKRFKKEAQSAEIAAARASFYQIQAAKYDYERPETEKYKTYNRKALEICTQTIENFPKSTGADKCKSIENRIKAISLNFESESYVVPNKNFAIKLRYKNVDTVYLRVASIQRDMLKNIRKGYNNKKVYEEILKKSNPLRNKTIALPVDKDYNPHSCELILTGLPLGNYVVFVANNPLFSYQENITSYGDIVATNLLYTSQKQYDNTVHFHIFDRTSGQAVEDVEVTVTQKEYDYNSRKYLEPIFTKLKTDKNGFFKLETKNGRDATNLNIKLKKGNDYIEPTESFYANKYEPRTYTRKTTYYFTDRAIYRPGQSVQFKGISIESKGENNRIVTNETNVVSFRDPNYQEISSLKLKTNKYGTFCGTFVIPHGLLNGSYQIRSAHGRHYIRVEEYKRPKFKVTFEPLEGSFRLDDSVLVKGKARAFAGSNITEAKVQYHVVRKPHWYGWRSWYRPEKETEIANGVLTTNEKGEFELKFKAVPDLSLGRNPYLSFNYQITADVTDTNGETQSKTTNTEIGYRALVLDIDIPEKVNQNKETLIDKGFDISTRNLNGEFIPAEGMLKIFLLKEPEKLLFDKKWKKTDKTIYTKQEWTKKLPNEVYSDENELFELKKEKEVYAQKFNTEKEKKVIIKNIKSWKNGRYVAELNSKDAFGNTVEQKKYFTIFNPKSKEIPYLTADWFVALNSKGEPGEKASFLIGSGAKEVKVLYEIEHKGKIKSREWIKIKNQQLKVEIPIQEEDRGNFAVHFSFVYHNRFFRHSEIVKVPYTNKQIDIRFETFRNKLLPGEKEEWRIKLKGKNGERVAAEMLATLYDASLDELERNNWQFDIYKTYYSQRHRIAHTLRMLNSRMLAENLNEYHSLSRYTYPKFNWFGFSYYNRRTYLNESLEMDMAQVLVRGSKSLSAAEEVDEEAEVEAYALDEKTNDEAMSLMADNEIKKDKSDKGGGLDEVKTRSNFSENAFFYPNLETNKEGEIVIKFTIPESLTQWRMMGFAHTEDLKYGFIENELVTQKDLMLVPNAPRFFRENDKMIFPVKISNISDKKLAGKARIEFFDAISLKPIKLLKENATKSFQLEAKENTTLNWQLKIPEYTGAVSYKVVAKAGNFTDGEENTLPVLSNRILLTESLPLPIRGKQNKTFRFKNLLDSEASTTLKHHKLTLEFTSNPAWYAVQALPYLMEYPYECSEQTFSRYYANTLASHIANSSPKIKRVFEAWKNNTQGNEEALLSNLEKNQELKSLLLEETPWVLNAQNETERKKRIALLFDLNKMTNEQEAALNKLLKEQVASGAWSWFPGMPESRYITQHIVCGMGHLDRLKVEQIRQTPKVWTMVKKAINYLDMTIDEDFRELKRICDDKELEKNHLNYMAIHYLYARSFFTDVPVKKNYKAAFAYYKKQSEKFWLSQGIYAQGMIALALHRYENKKIPKLIAKALKEHSTESEEMGRYWKSNQSGYFWYQAPIEVQALMIEVFDEVAQDEKTVEALKVWLLKQKQTQDWRTTKATVEAVYALLLRGTNLLTDDKLVDIKLGNQPVEPNKMENTKPEAGTGYFKTSWNGKEIKPEMGKVSVSKTTDGIAWGAIYWQYFEQLDKIKTHETPLKLKKKLFIEKRTPKGNVLTPITNSNKLKVGDKLIVRIELRIDRDMEYVHMKDMRAASFEPINVISQYKYQGGIGYYESTKDAATNFFISYLRKGTYVFEYPLRVSYQGDFSNGITTIQCMYAPEFTSHSEGVRVVVE